MRLWLAAWGESPQQTEGLHMRENAKAFRCASAQYRYDLREFRAKLSRPE